MCLPVVTTAQVRARLLDLEAFLLDEYKVQHPPQKRDWRTYEETWAHRIREVTRQLDPLLQQACAFAVGSGPGHPHALTVKPRVTIILLKTLFGQSNRRMAGMLAAFSLLAEVKVSYKTVERLYSDPAVETALDNLLVLMVRQRGIEAVDGCGDGTGYALSITQHYASTAQRLRDKAKENAAHVETSDPGKSEKQAVATPARKERKRRFVYVFRLLDLATHLYVAYGTSRESEKDAFLRALKRLEKLGIPVRSLRLDRYYSNPTDRDRFRGATMYLIPKKRATVKGSMAWKVTMQKFVDHTMTYLEEYYRRTHSEAGFSADKRTLGWGVAQRRDDRIDTAQTCHATWHNLLNLYGPEHRSSVAGTG